MRADLEALEHVEVLLSELEVLRQQAERFHRIKLARSEEAKDEVVVRTQEANVWTSHDHVTHLAAAKRRKCQMSEHNRPPQKNDAVPQNLLYVLVERVWVFVELEPSLLGGVGAEARQELGHPACVGRCHLH